MDGKGSLLSSFGLNSQKLYLIFLLDVHLLPVDELVLVSAVVGERIFFVWWQGVCNQDLSKQ